MNAGLISDEEADKVLLDWLERMHAGQMVSFFEGYPIYNNQGITPGVAENVLRYAQSPQGIESVDQLTKADIGFTEGILKSCRIYAKEAIAISLFKYQKIEDTHKLEEMHQLQNRQLLSLNQLVAIIQRQVLATVQQNDFWKEPEFHYKVPFVSLEYVPETVPQVSGEDALYPVIIGPGPSRFKRIRFQTWALGVHDDEHRWTAHIHFMQNHIQSITISK